LKTPDTCPNCGADVPERARSCPQCGADEKTGWSEDAYAGNLDLPDESFNYNEFAEREFGKKKVLPYGINWLWWTVATGLVILFVVGLLKWTR
jgi:uncharacterized membrane protein YvbJ